MQGLGRGERHPRLRRLFTAAEIPRFGWIWWNKRWHL